MEGREISTTQTSYVLQSWSKQKGLQPIPVQKAEGIYFYDYDGKRYADMSSQQVNVNLGYGNKDISEAIKNKLDQYAYIGPSYGDASRAELGKMIIDLLPDTFGKVFFTNAGADANENAIKIARMYTGRNKIFSRYRSYHGSSFGAGNLTGEPRRYPLEPGIPGFIKFFDPYLYRETIPFASEEEASRYYVEKLREQIIYEGPDRVAAIVLETITGSNGVIIPPKGYLPGVRKVCDEFGIVMICDEVMAGWARTGKMFAFENFDVIPDMITFAKGVTCGYIQLGGVAVSKKIAEYFDDRLRQLRLMVSRRLSHVQAAFFESKECLFAVLENLEPEELHRVLEQFQTEMSGAGSGMRLAAGEAVPLRELSVGFRRTAAVLRLAERRNQSPLYYDELSTEKLLISVSDTRVLEEYHRAVLGRLESYDHENGTHFVEILERYLFCDGSVQKVAEEMFVHRNTVNYQINRIKKILGKDLSSMEERMELMLAFQIRDVL